MHTFKEGEAAARYRGIRLKAQRSEHTTNVIYPRILMTLSAMSAMSAMSTTFVILLTNPAPILEKNKEEAMQQKLM